jgi:hypothetical protein
MTEPRKPIRLGTVHTIDPDTGEVAKSEQGAFVLPPPDPELCQACAHDHPPEMPHNHLTLHYQCHFYATHGRWPRWSDAMAHCSDEVRTAWKRALIDELRAHGLDVPGDLPDPKGGGH